jgi:hypothetical protein
MQYNTIQCNAIQLTLGLISAIGVSNFHVDDLQELLLLATAPVSVVQNWMDPFHQDIEVSSSSGDGGGGGDAIHLTYAMLCYAVLCYAMLCYAMLCYTMLYYPKLYYTYYTILCSTIPLLYSTIPKLCYP